MPTFNYVYYYKHLFTQYITIVLLFTLKFIKNFTLLSEKMTLLSETSSI